MSDAAQEPTGSHASTDEGPDYTGVPGWVKWLVITAVALGVVLLVALVAAVYTAMDTVSTTSARMCPCAQ